MSSLLENSTPVQRLDTGPTLVSIVVHNKYGAITIISNMVDDTGAVVVSVKFADQIPA